MFTARPDSRKWIAALVLGVFVFCNSAEAQQLPDAQTHEAAVESLLAQCVVELAPKSGPLAIARPNDTMPADPRVLGSLREGSRSISLATWEATSANVTLVRYQLGLAQVGLVREGRKQIRRTVDVSIPYTIIETDGRVTGAGTCTKSDVDVIPRSLAAEWAERFTSLPIAVDNLPREGLLKRIVRPAIAVAATSVSLYLLFSLRSERANDSQ